MVCIDQKITIFVKPKNMSKKEYFLVFWFFFLILSSKPYVCNCFNEWTYLFQYFFFDLIFNKYFVLLFAYIRTFTYVCAVVVVFVEYQNTYIGSAKYLFFCKMLKKNNWIFSQTPFFIWKYNPSAYNGK